MGNAESTEGIGKARKEGGGGGVRTFNQFSIRMCVRSAIWAITLMQWRYMAEKHFQVLSNKKLPTIPHALIFSNIILLINIASCSQKVTYFM